MNLIQTSDSTTAVQRSFIFYLTDGAVLLGTPNMFVCNKWSFDLGKMKNTFNVTLPHITFLHVLQGIPLSHDTVYHQEAQGRQHKERIHHCSLVKGYTYSDKKECQ